MKHSKLPQLLIFSALICFGLMVPTQAHCQVSETAISQKVKTLIAASRYQETIDLLTINQKRKTQNFSKSFLFHSLATCYIRLGQFEKGLVMLDSLDHVLTNSGNNTVKVDALTLRAVCYTHYDQKEKALKYSSDAFTHINRVKSISPAVTANTYTVLGEIYRFHYSRLLDAQRFFLKADSTLTLSPNDNIHEQATLYLHLINNSRELLQNEEALMYSRKAMTLIKPIQFLEPLLYTRILTAIGNVYFVMQDLKTAEDYQKRAVNVSNRYRINSSYRLLAYNNLGAVYINKPDLKKAIEIYSTAAQFIDQESIPRSSLTYLSLGYAYQVNDNEDSALHYLKKSLKVRLQLYGDKDYRVGIAYQYLGYNFSKFNQPDSALHYFQRALISSFPNFTSTDIFENPSITLNDELEGFASILTDKAKALFALSNQTKKISFAESALNLYALMDSLYFISLQRNISDRSGIQIAEYFSGHLKDGLATGAHLHQEKSNQLTQQRLLQLLESNKSVILYNALQKNNKAFEFSYLSTLDSLQKIIHLKQQILSTANHKIELIRLKGKTTEILKDFNDKRHLLAETYSSPYGISLKQIQQELDRINSSILTYHVDGTSIYSMGISSTETKFHTLDIDDSLKEALHEFKHLVAKTPAFGKEALLRYQELAYSLYQKLVLPILPNGNNQQLIIMPDGILRLLPFEAFVIKPQMDAEGFHQLHYLIGTTSISYSPSIRVWLTLQKQTPREQPLNTILAINSDELKGSEQEVSFLKTVNNTTILPASTLEQDDFFTLLGASKIGHLSLHGISDSLGNRLMLSSLNNHFIHEEEIYKTPLPYTKLAFLGSCDSHLGETFASEGTLSLARAFMFAGCQVVVASLWKLPDTVTPGMVKEFYSALLVEELRTDQALRKAKIHYIKNADSHTGHPHFWSALTISGANTAFRKSSYINKGLYLFLLIALLLGGMLILRSTRMHMSIRSKVNSNRID